MLPLLASAKGYKGEFKVELTYKTSLSYSEKHILERKNDKMKLNGVKLVSEQILLGKKYISYLVMSKNSQSKKQHCSAGTYQFTTTKIKQKPKVESGCIGSKRFGNLLEAFRKI